MKKGIHPDYQPTTIRCACGNVIETGSTNTASNNPAIQKNKPLLQQSSRGFFVFYYLRHQPRISFTFSAMARPRAL